MTGKHTPAPWIPRMQRSREGRPQGWIIETERGDRIGWSSYADMVTNKGDLPQSEPNAYLIAAAPELLEAALDLLAWLEDAGDSDTYDATAALRHAAGKAEGREP